MSAWRSPKNPQRKPNPKASDVSGSKVNAASLRLSFSERLAEFWILLGVGRVQPAEHDRLGRFEAGNDVFGRPLGEGESVAYLRVGDIFDARREPPHFAGVQHVGHGQTRLKKADFIDLELFTRAYDFDDIPFFDLAVQNADKRDDALITVIDCIEDEAA